MAKVRLDNLLVTRGLAESRAKAQALIMAGSVRVAGQSGAKAGLLVDEAAPVEVTAALPYASRGGYKLAHALDQFGLDPGGLAALDAGASTGGFTDVLLQRGAARVYAVDVGYGILDYRLRADPRVVVMERVNIRYLEALPENAHAGCAVIDVSFISLRLVLPAVRRMLEPEGWAVALVKPQFEAGPEQVGKGGVVRDPKVHRAVLREALAAAAEAGLAPRGLARSPITGPAGNVEFLAWLQPGGPALDIETTIEGVL
jgi:23S rRNA (cytidine1920-2'-O)/16S rRNA (cytidine1409-2'-O)-methyltransferase